MDETLAKIKTLYKDLDIDQKLKDIVYNWRLYMKVALDKQKG
jgi:hypothetical protein